MEDLEDVTFLALDCDGTSEFWLFLRLTFSLLCSVCISFQGRTLARAHISISPLISTSTRLLLLRAGK